MTAKVLHPPLPGIKLPTAVLRWWLDNPGRHSAKRISVGVAESYNGVYYVSAHNVEKLLKRWVTTGAVRKHRMFFNGEPTSRNDYTLVSLEPLRAQPEFAGRVSAPLIHLPCTEVDTMWHREVSE